jgi:RTX calcium-binding nonapeptide repeat (4 copies)
MAFVLQAGAAQFVGMTCTYVEAGAPGPPGNVLRIDGSQAEEDALALRRTGEEIEVVDISRVKNSDNLTSQGQVLKCDGGTPTVTNVDSIQYLAGVNVGPSVQLDERGGTFAPGASDEGDGSSEIEISIDRLSTLLVGGTQAADDIAIGRTGARTGFNLDAAESNPDVDLQVPRHFESAGVLGLGGADRLSLAGARNGFPSGAPHVGGLGFAIVGGSGDDVLIGGSGNDGLAGEAGADLLRAGPGDDILELGAGRDRAFGGGGTDFTYAQDGRRDRVNCGPALDFAKVDDRDRLKGCEDFPPHRPAA